MSSGLYPELVRALKWEEERQSLASGSAGKSVKSVKSSLSSSGETGETGETVETRGMHSPSSTSSLDSTSTQHLYLKIPDERDAAKVANSQHWTRLIRNRIIQKS